MSAVALPLHPSALRAHALPALRPVAYPAYDGELVLVVNANASGVRRNPGIVSQAAFALRAAGGQVELRVTESAAELAAVAADPDRRLVLLGGDGTMHALANLPAAQAEARAAAGGWREQHRELPRDPHRPLRRRRAGRQRQGARDRRHRGAQRHAARVVVVEGVSVGFHALARARYSAVNSTDVRAAVGAGFSAIRAFHPVPVALELDGEAELVPARPALRSQPAPLRPAARRGARCRPGRRPDRRRAHRDARPARHDRSSRVAATRPRSRKGSCAGARGASASSPAAARR